MVKLARDFSKKKDRRDEFSLKAYCAQWRRFYLCALCGRNNSSLTAVGHIPFGNNGSWQPNVGTDLTI